MKKLRDSLLKIILWIYECTKKQFLTVHTRPICAQNYGLWSDPVNLPTSMAIVMQGPLCLENNFTLETVRIYKKNFPGVTIILSTWEGENEETLNLIKKEGVEIITNKVPVNPGNSHINYQITSTYAGIALAKKLRAEYVLKTRTDLRMYAPNIQEFLVGLLTTFPVREGYIQKKRIVVTSLITWKYRMYSVTDITMFGDIEDLLLYWSLPLDPRIPFSQPKKFGEWAKCRICEVYLTTSFLEKIGRKLLWTLQDSWSVYAEHFCVIDEESLDIYWHKYDRYKHYRFSVYDSIRTDQELTFREWLILYSRVTNKSQIPEYVSELRRGQQLTK